MCIKLISLVLTFMNIKMRQKIIFLCYKITIKMYKNHYNQGIFNSFNQKIKILSHCVSIYCVHAKSRAITTCA